MKQKIINDLDIIQWLDMMSINFQFSKKHNLPNVCCHFDLLSIGIFLESSFRCFLEMIYLLQDTLISSIHNN